MSPSSATDQEYPVLIAGGGLIGLSTAMFLAQHGIASLAVERLRAGSQLPRAAFFHMRTLEMFRSCGIEDQVRAQSAKEFEPEGALIIMDTLSGKKLADIIPSLNEGVDALSPCRRLFCTQPGLEPILKDRALQAGAKVLDGHEVIGVAQDPGGVSLTVQDTATGTERTLRGKYLVGADGAHSKVRELLDIPFDGRGVFSNSITIYFTADLSPQLLGKPLSVIYINNARLGGFFRMSKDCQSGFLVVNTVGDPKADPKAAADAAADVSEAKLIEFVRAGVGNPSLAVRIDGLARWRATSDVARKFQQGRVFLAGDAAHLMPPNGGFGGNTGIHDAHNLAWKLALVLKGTADPKLLATYEVERKPVGKFTVEQAYTRYVTRTAPYLGAKDFQPPANDFNIELGYLYRSPAIVPDGSEEKEHDDPRHTFGRPGSRAPHLWLERGGAGWTAQSAGRVSTLDLFGRAFVLLAGPDGAAWCSAAPQAAKAFPGLELQAHHIGGPALRDPDGRFAAAYGITPAGAVLVRPDGFVVWRAKQKESGAADAIARALRTALAKELSTTPILQTHFAAATHHAPTGCQAAGDCSITAPQDAAGSAHRREDVMKLYMHPVSMTSRPVRLFMAEKGLTADEEVIDLMTGAHYQEPYASLNPNKLVPMLDDDGFKLTESSAILKYLAEKFDLPEYPKDLKQRAKVNEMMDWLNTNFYREWGYGLCYPQLFPHLKRPDDNVQKATVEWGKEQSKKWLQILNDHWIGPNNQYLTGNTITIADYFGAGLVTLGELIRCDMAPYPNVTRWLDNMKKLKSWPQVNEVFNGLKDQLKGQPFVAV